MVTGEVNKMKIEIVTERVITEKIVYEVEIDDNQNILTRNDFYAVTETFQDLFLNNKEIFTQTQIFKYDTGEEIEDIQRKFNDANREINSRKNIF